MSEVYDYFQQGRRHLRKGMAAQATVPLEKAKRREPNKASIRESLGIAYFRIGRYDEAAAEFRAVLELSPADDYAHYALGRCLEKQGHTAEANGHYKLAALPAAGQRDVRLAGHRTSRAESGRPAGLARVGLARRRDRSGAVRAARRRARRHRGRRGAARRQGREPADLRERRGQVRPLAARHGRRGARRLAVHADRRHGEGQPAELLGGGAARGGGAGLRGVLRRAARAGRRGRRRACSAPGWRSSSSTTARSRSFWSRVRLRPDPVPAETAAAILQTPHFTGFEMGARRPFVL